MKALVFSRGPPATRPRWWRAPCAPGAVPATARCRCATSTRPTCRAPAGTGCGPACPGSAAATSPPSTARSSRYFEPIVSFPFTPGHEIVGDLDDGRRVVVIPVLHCAARGINPPCDMCQAGRDQPVRAGGVRQPRARPAVRVLRVDRRRLVAGDGGPRVPGRGGARRADRRGGGAGRADGLRRARRAARSADDVVAVIGAGALGLLTIAALGALGTPRGPFIATAKHPEQQRWAKELGADTVCAPGSSSGSSARRRRRWCSTTGSSRAGSTP